MRRTLLAIAGLVAGVLPVQAQTVELLHFWDDPSEQAALSVFADSYRQRGGDWHGISRPNEITLKIYAIERITNGYAPTAVQWHGGPDVAKMLDLGITDPLDAVASEQRLDALHPSIAAMLRTEDGIGALPVGLHGENWAWRNLNIYRALALSPPRDWEDFLRQAPLIKEAGYRPLAVGRAAWERAVVFSSILIDLGGAALYNSLIEGRLDEVTHRPAIERAFDLLLRLRDEATSAEHAHASWGESTADVIEGRAAMQVMGDWAKGEFLNANKKAGRDFDCSLAPGNDGVMSIILDVFVFPRTDNATIREAQTALAETVLDAGNQRRFSLIKGSLPVIDAVSMEGFDKCARTGVALASNGSSNVASVSLALDQEAIAQIYDAVQTAWDSPDMDAQAASRLFFERIPRSR